MKPFKKYVTIGDKYHPAMKIVTQDDADEYFELCVRHSMKFGKSREEAERVERSNLGYFAGYYSSDVRQRVERLFKCAHPILGSIDERGIPTPEEAFLAGVSRGSKK